MDGQLDFLGLISEYTDNQGAKVRVREPVKKSPKKAVSSDFEQISMDLEPVEFECNDNLYKEEIKIDGIKLESPLNDTDSVIEFGEEKKNLFEPTKVEKKAKKTETDDKKPIPLFGQCTRCWCYDCKHNSRNEGIPREICGTRMACPACNDCISEDMATICEIGNAKEGCRTRALEEGITDTEYT